MAPLCRILLNILKVMMVMEEVVGCTIIGLYKVTNWLKEQGQKDDEPHITI